MTPFCSLKMEVTRSSKTLIITYRITRLHNPQAHSPHLYVLKSLRSQTILVTNNAPSETQPQASSSRRWQSPWATNRALVHRSEGMRHRAEGCMALRWWQQCCKRCLRGTGQHPAVCVPSTCWWRLFNSAVLVGLIWTTEIYIKNMEKALAELKFTRLGKDF
jgi:hypothetical protein